ncbi:MAG: cytidine deaminase [Melioribacteraceae bacterium]|nr:cytidine deaminase [Melioribacteraceae bacterium]
MKNEQLLKKAEEAKNLSYSPYSKFRVGAALLDEKGNIHLGTNIENSSYSLTLCAERTAVFEAYLKGARKFRAIAITSDSEKIITPCGACRQVLMEMCGPELEVIMFDKHGNTQVEKLKSLLPLSFDESFL